MLSWSRPSPRLLLLGAAALLLVLLTLATLFSRYLPANLTGNLTTTNEALVGGELAGTTLSQGAHTLTFRGKTRSGGHVTDTAQLVVGTPGSSPTPPPPGTQLNVRDFGAVGDGVTDDTAAIQRAVDAARAGSIKTVFFPPATYRVSSVNISPNLTLLGYGVTLKRLPHQPKFGRMFTTSVTGYKYSGDVDSPPLIIKGFRFDGNRLEQGDYTHFELEQQHMIFLMADLTKPGRLRAEITDVTLVEGAADGISIFVNVDALLQNITAENVFRGGIQIGGGYSNVRVINYTAGGNVWRTGLHTEVNGTGGYGGDKSIHIVARHLHVQDFTIGLQPGSTFIGSDIIAGPPFVVAAPEAMMRISNSAFDVGPVEGPVVSADGFATGEEESYVIWPHDIIILDTAFHVTELLPNEQSRQLTALPVRWNNSSTNFKNQTIDCRRCTFTVRDNVEASDTTYAVTTGIEPASQNNRLIIRDNTIGSDFDYGLYMQGGGNWIITNKATNAIAAAVPVRLKRHAANFWWNVLLDHVTPALPLTIEPAGDATNPNNVLRIIP